MNLTLSDSLKNFDERQVSSGRFGTADAFVEDLIRTEAEMLERAERGEPLPLDEHFDRRLEAVLNEGERNGNYQAVTPGDFDAMQREAQELAQLRKPR